MYIIGTYKNGQQVAKEVFSSENLEEVKREFQRLWESTDFCADNADEAWNYKHFSEDTSNVAVFKVEEDSSPYKLHLSRMYFNNDEIINI